MRRSKTRTENANAVAHLEEHYANRGLKFLVPFIGGAPVQAWGEIDGQRFYFRFRGNSASLVVGPVDEELDHLYAARLVEDDISRLKREKKVSLFSHRQHVQSPDADDYQPRLITKSSSLYPVFTQDEKGSDVDYLGFLTAKESREVFSVLFETLTGIPEEQQINPSTRLWLYGGRAAKDQVEAAWGPKQYGEDWNAYVTAKALTYLRPTLDLPQLQREYEELAATLPRETWR